MKTNLVRVLFGLLMATAIMAQAPQANAQDENGWVGGLFGLAVPDGDDMSARPIWGITGGAKIGSEFGLGAYYLNSNKDEEVGAGKVETNMSLYGLEGAYHFEGEAHGVYLGGRLGMTKIEIGTIDYSPMHWGVVGGYNHMLGSAFSIGADVSYLMVSKDDATVLGFDVPLESFGMLNFMASAKFWF